MATVVKLEQIGEDKIAIDKESFKTIQALVSCTAANLIIPDDVDRKTDIHAQLVATTIATTAALTLMALYDSEIFVDVMQELNVANGEIYTTMETIRKKGKEMFS